MRVTTDSIDITAMRVGGAFVCVSNNVKGINIAKTLRMSLAWTIFKNKLTFESLTQVYKKERDG